MDKELEKCGCGSDCGCGENNHDCGCGGHEHDHDSCGCGCGEHESFVIDLEDENGNVITCPIIDEFECEDNQYYLAQNPNENSVYLFKLVGEELVSPDEEEFERVSAYYQNELVGQ
ncbi:MAG: DUF1292 domain-containing protein [Clostridium sp.]